MVDELRDKGFNFPFLLHQLVMDINGKSGSEFIEGVTRLYDNIIGAYDKEGDFEIKIENMLAAKDKEMKRMLGRTSIWAALTPEAKAAASRQQGIDFEIEYSKARIIFRECMKKVENLLPEKIIHGIIEDEGS